ncbi:CaiB/BaiF CoA transferase family protein [Luteimonas saliphila]|uniref:CaiB/BaiF CoA transferase family protein n=1 Tax=Luteimonas saliphila TaxID=2804919 RepID=UPI00192E134A|nr:CaiB/BaiF CoA-transferase family protein [Luteimonas saliphila]
MAEATPSSPGPSAAPRALDGIKVLDVSRVLAGPWCTQILADFGADVIKIESIGKGDDTRRWGPPDLPSEPGWEHSRESAYYLSCNRNKRSVAIDLAMPQGAALVRRLAARADVLVENFKVGGLKKFGLDYDGLHAVNPRLVYCSVTGFGQTGPYADRPGYDFVAQAMGGMMSITGEKDGPPIKPGVAMADLSTGMYAAVSVLIALRHAERTGEGQHIDCSLLDTQIATLANQGLSYLVGGVSPGRLGNAHPTVVPYRVFDAADGSIVVAVGNDSQFHTLCVALGTPELAADPRYVGNHQRVIHRDTLEATLQAAIGRRTVDALIATLCARGVPCGPVNTIGQIFADPFVEARGVVHRFQRADGVEIPSVAFPGKFSHTPASFDRPPPHVGEHTGEVLGQWLGLDDDERERLRQGGAIAG